MSDELIVTYTQVFCGRYINGHMLVHEQSTNHKVALSLADLSVWCFGCDSYVHNEVGLTVTLTHKHIRTHTLTLTHTLSHTLTPAHKHIRTHTLTCTNTYVHTHTHTQTHTYIHTHSHAQVLLRAKNSAHESKFGSSMDGAK